MDSYTDYAEYIVKRKKDTKDYLIYIAACVIAFLCSFIVLSIQMLAPYIVILFWILVGIWYVAYRVITSRNIEFEYCFSYGDLYIDKIINRKRRKRILSVDTRSFDMFEALSEELLDKIKSIPQVKIIHAEGDISSPEVYVASFNKSGVKNYLFIQPNERILSAIARRRR